MRNFILSFLFISVMFLNSCGGGGSSTAINSNTVVPNNDGNSQLPTDINTTNIDNGNSQLPQEENATTPIKEENTTATSSGIYVTQSSESTKNIYEFFNHPFLYEGKAYTRLYRYYGFNVDTGMQVVEYDLSKFTSDMSLDNLLSKTIYAQTQPASKSNPDFNLRYYNLLQLDDALYFSGLPDSKEEKSQSVRIKYDLSSKSIAFNNHKLPLTGKDNDRWFDLTRGWFVPFNSNSNIAIIEESASKVIDVIDGSSYQYGGHDYLSEWDNVVPKISGMPPVSNNERFIAVANEDNLDTKNSIYSVKIIADKNSVKYGVRDGKLKSNDPEYIVSDILEDFKALYSGSKNYYLANYGGDTSGLGTPELILDGDYVYNIAKLGYDNSEGNRINDLYLLKYDLKANLLDIKLLEDGTDIINPFYAYQPYKYGDNIIFKLAKNSENYIYSYNLKNDTFNFKHQIGTKDLAGLLIRDTELTSYIVTGDTIILPEFVKYTEQSNDNEVHYSVVFRVLDINNGTVLKTLTHPSLENLVYGYDYKAITITSSLSDKNSVYFFGQKYTKEANDKLIIKIDSPNNKVIKSKYRMDNQHTGVIK